MLIADNPKNETKEHYELKQIAKYLLYDRGYKHIATEVYGVGGRDYSMIDGCSSKDVIDTIGIKTNGWYDGKPKEMKCMGFEAKASLSDYKNGFCTACELTYIIAPRGIIPVDKLPKGIGLIEVDLKNYWIASRYGKIIYHGIETVKQAQSRMANKFKNKEQYQNWCLSMFRSIAYRSTVENLFNNPNIKLHKEIFNKETFEWDII